MKIKKKVGQCKTDTISLIGTSNFDPLGPTLARRPMQCILY